MIRLTLYTILHYTTLYTYTHKQNVYSLHQMKEAIYSRLATVLYGIIELSSLYDTTYTYTYTHYLHLHLTYLTLHNYTYTHLHALLTLTLNLLNLTHLHLTLTLNTYIHTIIHKAYTSSIKWKTRSVAGDLGIYRGPIAWLVFPLRLCV